jgi:hypothetical protein
MDDDEILRDRFDQALPPAPAPRATDSMAQEAVPVNANPLTPDQDATQSYEWRIVPWTPESQTLTKEVRRLTEEEAFEFASALTGTGNVDAVTNLHAGHRGYMLLFRRKKRAEFDKERDTLATLQHQQKMLEIKLEIDKLSVAITNFRKENATQMRW